MTTETYKRPAWNNPLSLNPPLEASPHTYPSVYRDSEPKQGWRLLPDWTSADSMDGEEGHSKEEAGNYHSVPVELMGDGNYIQYDGISHEANSPEEASLETAREGAMDIDARKGEEYVHSTRAVATVAGEDGISPKNTGSPASDLSRAPSSITNSPRSSEARPSTSPSPSPVPEPLAQTQSQPLDREHVYSSASHRERSSAKRKRYSGFDQLTRTARRHRSNSSTQSDDMLPVETSGTGPEAGSSLRSDHGGGSSLTREPSLLKRVMNKLRRVSVASEMQEGEIRPESAVSESETTGVKQAPTVPSGSWEGHAHTPTSIIRRASMSVVEPIRRRRRSSLSPSAEGDRRASTPLAEASESESVGRPGTSMSRRSALLLKRMSILPSTSPAEEEAKPALRNAVSEEDTKRQRRGSLAASLFHGFSLPGSDRPLSTSSHTHENNSILTRVSSVGTSHKPPQSRPRSFSLSTLAAIKPFSLTTSHSTDPMSSAATKPHKRLGFRDLGFHAYEREMPRRVRRVLEQQPTQVLTNILPLLRRHWALSAGTTRFTPCHGATTAGPSRQRSWSRNGTLVAGVDVMATRKVYFCDDAVDQYFKFRNEGHFCGYRSIQMMTSYILSQQDPSTLPSSTGPDSSSPGSQRPISSSMATVASSSTASLSPGGRASDQALRPEAPSIFEIQNTIEEAWSQGINAYGRVETGGIRGTRKFIGTPEAQAFFRHYHVPVRLHRIKRATKEEAGRDLMRLILAYFQQKPAPVLPRDIVAEGRSGSIGFAENGDSGMDLDEEDGMRLGIHSPVGIDGDVDDDGIVQHTSLPPLYLQTPRHSMVVVGIELLQPFPPEQITTTTTTSSDPNHSSSSSAVTVSSSPPTSETFRPNTAATYAETSQPLSDDEFGLSYPNLIVFDPAYDHPEPVRRSVEAVNQAWNLGVRGGYDDRVTRYPERNHAFLDMYRKSLADLGHFKTYEVLRLG